MRQSSTSSMLLLGIWIVFTVHLSALDYTNSSLRFKAKLPDGLEDVSMVPMFKGKLISLGRLNESRTGLTKAIVLDDLGAPIKRDDMSKLPTPGNASWEKHPWRSFQIDVARVQEQSGGIQTITFNAQVPLKSHAIQVTVFGLAAEEKQLREDLGSILASIQGESNWLTTAERTTRGAEGISKLAAIIAVLIVVGGLDC